MEHKAHLGEATASSFSTLNHQFWEEQGCKESAGFILSCLMHKSQCLGFIYTTSIIIKL